MDLGFSYTSLLRSDLSLCEKTLALYREARWPIHAFHATFTGGSRFFEDTVLELTDDDERTRRGVRNHILAAAAIAGPGSILVLHLGTVKGSSEKAMERSLRVLEAFLPLAEEKRVILALENMPRPSSDNRIHLGADYRELQRVLDRLRSPCLKICLDWGHANDYAEVFATKEGRAPLDAYIRSFGYCREIIEELGKEIVYAHIHYNRNHESLGEASGPCRDEHMPLTRIPPQYWDPFCDTLSLLMEKSSIRETGSINLELIPRRFFGCYTALPTGGGLREQLESVRLLRGLLNSEPQ